MCDPVTAIIGSAIVGGAMQKSAAKKQAAAQQQAQDQATRQAAATAEANRISAQTAKDDADKEFNRVNGKQPDVAGISARNSLESKGGVSGTMLTGPQGVDPKNLLLGKTTLLGG